MPQPRSTIRSGSASVGCRSWPLASASVIEESSSRRNSSTWRYFACRVGLIRPCASEIPSATSTGSSSASSRCLSRSWPRSAATGSARSCVETIRLELLGDAQLVGLGRGVDVPVAEGLVEQRVHRRLGLAAQSEVGGVRLRLVERRDLQVPSGLEVDVAELDAAYGASLHLRLWLTLPTSGCDGADQSLGVEEVCADQVQRVGEGKRSPSEQRGDDDDQDECPQRDRDDEAAVVGVHPLILLAGRPPEHRQSRASFRGSCEAGAPSRPVALLSRQRWQDSRAAGRVRCATPRCRRARPTTPSTTPPARRDVCAPSKVCHWTMCSGRSGSVDG